MVPELLKDMEGNTGAFEKAVARAEKLSREITFDQDGPNGIEFILGFHIQSLDSIFLFNQSGSVITLADTTGQIKNKIEYTIPEGQTNAFVHNAYFGSAPRLKGNQLWVKTHIPIQYSKITADLMQKSVMGYQINLEDGSTSLQGISYPEDYLAGGLKFYEPSLVFQPDFTVYSLFGDHRIFKESKNGIEPQVQHEFHLADLPDSGDGRISFRLRLGCYRRSQAFL